MVSGATGDIRKGERGAGANASSVYSFVPRAAVPAMRRFGTAPHYFRIIGGAIHLFRVGSSPWDGHGGARTEFRRSYGEAISA